MDEVVKTIVVSDINYKKAKDNKTIYEIQLKNNIDISIPLNSKIAITTEMNDEPIIVTLINLYTKENIEEMDKNVREFYGIVEEGEHLVALELKRKENFFSKFFK